jgi:hypothetical protein
MSPGPEDLVDQDEKRRILREQASTYHQHAVAQAGELSGGRFGVATPAPTVTGSTATPKVPQLPSSSPWSGAQPEPGIEPSLGYSIDQLTDPEQVLSTPEPSLASASVQDTAPVSAAPSSEVAPPSADAVETSTGAPSSIGDPAVVEFASHPDTLIPSVDAGSPSTNQDDDNA